MEQDAREREIQALISMIDDPDPQVFREISLKIIQIGYEALPFIEETEISMPDKGLRERIASIKDGIRYEQLSADLFAWAVSPEKDLLSAWLSVSRYSYPDICDEKIRTEVDRIRQDAWLEINKNLTALEQIKVFNHVFYGIHHFQGNLEDYHDPDNSVINRVLKSRKGSPLSMGLLYMLVARSLDIPVQSINLPEHFVLAYMGDTVNTSRVEVRKCVPLFYINAFSGGDVFSVKEINKFLERLDFEPLPEFFRPCTDLEILIRMLNSLSAAYDTTGDSKRKYELDNLRNRLEESFT
ncbi:MAG: transglutaminase-like domain-containing protein [Bacteroidales bacterium]